MLLGINLIDAVNVAISFANLVLKDMDDLLYAVDLRVDGFRLSGGLPKGLEEGDALHFSFGDQVHVNHFLTS